MEKKVEPRVVEVARQRPQNGVRQQARPRPRECKAAQLCQRTEVPGPKMAKRVEASDVLMFGGNLGRQSESRHFTFTESTFPMLEFFGWMLGRARPKCIFFLERAFFATFPRPEGQQG